MAHIDHGDGDHHGEHVLWRWRSPLEIGPYCVTTMRMLLFCFTLHDVMLEVERPLTNFKLCMPSQLKLAPSHVLYNWWWVYEIRVSLVSLD